MAKKMALALTGGGARGAYQAGVLKGISEILASSGRSAAIPFPIISGVSAGSINAAFLGCQKKPFVESAQDLCNIWTDLKSGDVIKTDMVSLGGTGARWFRDLSSGGFFGKKDKVTHLLDSTPLHGFLSEKVDFPQMRENIRTGAVHGISFTATSYRTGTAISFFDGDPSIQPWSRSSRIGKRARLEIDHILASASIPIFFRPVPIGHAYYGDGGIRLNTPLSPAIHLGADKVLAIGIRYSRPDALVYELNEKGTLGEITLADISGVLLNALFLDALDSDVERMIRINQTIDLLSPEKVALHPSQLRKIPLLAIKPSRDLGALAADQFEKFPRLLRFMLKGTGASNDKGWDMLSYLAFDSSYTGLLIEVGYEDALRQRAEIAEFFADT